MFLLFFISLTFAERYGSLEEFCPDLTIPEKSGKNIRLCSRDKDCSKGYKCTDTIQKHFGVTIKYCCQTRESICSLPPNPGYGNCSIGTSIKYYFDTFELRCKSFKHFPCQGTNQNQFATMQECQRFCQSTACSAGESLLVSSSNKPVTCANSDVCIDGYHCVFDSLFRRHVCCGRHRESSCPLGTLAYASPRDYRPLQCEHSPIGDSCPPDFLCTGHGPSYCCTPEHGICPLGQVGYEHPLTGRSMKCDPLRVVSECPSNYSCAPAVPGASFGFCCSIAVKAQCPLGSHPYLEPITYTPVKCTVGVSMCGVGFICQSTTSSIIGFCCTRPQTSSLTKLEVINEYHSDSEKKSSVLQNSRTVENFETDNKIETMISTPKRTSSTVSILSNYLFCPNKGKPVYYQGSQLIMECTAVVGLNNKCPGDSSCVLADGDILNRSICCKMPMTLQARKLETKPTVPSPYFIYTVTSKTPAFKLKTTNDPFCPSVIERDCQPGYPLDCNEISFFCQYNIALEKFVCCSMEITGPKQTIE